MSIKAKAVALWVALRILFALYGIGDRVALAVLRTVPVAAGLVAGAGLYWWMSR